MELGGFGVLKRPAIDTELSNAIDSLFRNTDAARAVFGEGPAAFPESWLGTNVSPAIPIQERVRMLDREYRGQLIFLVRQLEELGEGDEIRLEAEGMAFLICLRELMRHFPEILIDPPGSPRSRRDAH